MLKYNKISEYSYQILYLFTNDNFYHEDIIQEAKIYEQLNSCISICDLYKPLRLKEIDYLLESNDLRNYNIAFDHLYECVNSDCSFNRNNTCIRTKFEKKVSTYLIDKFDINVLFYNSYMLLQELNMILQNKNHISEIHLVDIYYQSIGARDEYCPGKNYNRIEESLFQFMQFLKINNVQSKVYLHVNPIQFTNCGFFNKCIDLILGIDMYYNCDMGIMKKYEIEFIAEKLLKNDGKLIICQNFEDQMEISEYIINPCHKLELTELTDYVQKKYYWKYRFENILSKIYYPMILFGLYISFIINPCHKLELTELTDYVQKKYYWKYRFENILSKIYYPMILFGLYISFI